MTHVVVSACVDKKYQECVAVCPVECFKEAGTYLVIDPDECIDCGACIPECPVEAILPDTEPDITKWLEINTEYADKWPNINRKGEPPADADEWRDKPNKAELFSPEPGQGV